MKEKLAKAIEGLKAERDGIDALLKMLEHIEKDRDKLLALAARLMGATGKVEIHRVKSTGRHDCDRVHFDHPDSRVVHAFKETFSTYGIDPLLDAIESVYNHLKPREL